MKKVFREHNKKKEILNWIVFLKCKKRMKSMVGPEYSGERAVNNILIAGSTYGGRVEIGLPYITS